MSALRGGIAPGRRHLKCSKPLSGLGAVFNSLLILKALGILDHNENFSVSQNKLWCFCDRRVLNTASTSFYPRGPQMSLQSP